MTMEEMADAMHLKNAKTEGMKKVEEESSSSNQKQGDEDLSSDEEYYRELERIKALGEGQPLAVTRKDHSSSSQHEGGEDYEGGSNEEGEKAPESDRREGPAQSIAKK